MPAHRLMLFFGCGFRVASFLWASSAADLLHQDALTNELKDEPALPQNNFSC